MTRQPQHQYNTSGFTLVELLVVISIIGMLIAILLPAVNSARESARQMTCKNNLRQQAIAVKSYAQDFPEELPPIWQPGKLQPWENFSWRVSLLPYVEEQARFDRINRQLLPLDSANLAAGGPVEVFECPSSPGSPRLVRQLGERTDLELGTTDYAPVFEVRGPYDPFIQVGSWFGAAPPTDFSSFDGSGVQGPEVSRVPPDEYSAQIRKLPATLRRVRDGLSNTVLLVEQAGKPKIERHKGATQINDNQPLPEFSNEGAWMTAEYATFSATGVNQNNHQGPYGYHTGAMVAMCDGSIHFWSRDMSEEVMRALLTREGSEIVSSDDWR